jgi:hypothetical protein
VHISQCNVCLITYESSNGVQVVPIHPALEVTFRASTGTIAALSPSALSNFSYVPLDGDFGINRTLSWFSALGDVYMRLRPASTQALTLPPLPYLEAFPIYTSLSTANANPGLIRLHHHCLLRD